MNRITVDRSSAPVDKPQVNHKRSKSSTSVLRSIIPTKGLSKTVLNKGKENITPPTSSLPSTPPIHTPIWAEFASPQSSRDTQVQVVTTTTKVPLNERTVDQEISLYMPKDYSPSKQRNFYDIQPPMLGRSGRPKTEYLPKSQSISIFETFSRTTSDKTQKKEQEASLDASRSSSDRILRSAKLPSKADAAPTRSGKHARSVSRDLLTMAKKGSKVMGMVAAFNSKSTSEISVDDSLDSEQIDAAFEVVLESRNIPENMREKMRSLKTSVKADFIRSNKEPTSTVKAKSAPNTTKNKTVKSKMGSTDEFSQEEEDDDDRKISTKRSRTRSKTFTFGKGGISPKKHKGEVTDGTRARKSVDIPKSPSTTSLGKSNGAGFFKSAKSSVPEDFVSYLRKEQRPEVVEVGKIHRLRQILRNETVAWVESFITLGGMAEIVTLLHRIMEVEWREEHEDQLLHEALLCLKALCTTDIALQKLSEIEKTLFPALLQMLFDPEHKGPSEFTTRTIIINIMFAHLTAVSKDLPALYARAKTILSYLADPAPPEDKRPVPFILDMRQSRPYKIWCREVVNVTKEVFWIFLHHLNVVPLPQDGNRPPSSDGNSTARLEANITTEEYAELYFPRPRPPVPAAPYVGGVEWDATNYLAAHLDLLNGLIAAMPTKQERNELRQEMLVSGWEKVMGASLRTCKEKFYDNIHDGLRTWVASAVADGWGVRDVRMGPKLDIAASPRKSPKKSDKAPILDAPPRLDLGLGLDDLKSGNKSGDVKEWL